MLKVKICGITRSEDAIRCAAKGAWAIGFIFAKESPRYIEPEAASEIVKIMKQAGFAHTPAIVGVFVNQSREAIENIKHRVGIDLVQLHGEESLDEIKAIAPDTVACHLQGPEDLQRGRLLSDVTKYLLVDSRSENQRGGTGLVADWDLARQMKVHHPLIILAGGISAQNILQAQRSVAPFAFDLSSSVESAPGIKCHRKLDQLFDLIGENK